MSESYFKSIALLILISMAACASQPRDDESVFDAYVACKNALNGKDGKSLIDMLSRSSLEHYDEVWDLATSGLDTESLERPMIHRIHVAKYRSFFQRSTLLEIPSREALAMFIAGGVFDSGRLTRSEQKMVSISGERAKLLSYIGSNRKEREFHFVWENGGWRLNLIPVYIELSTSFEKMRDDAGLSDKQLLDIVGKALPMVREHQKGD